MELVLGAWPSVRVGLDEISYEYALKQDGGLQVASHPAVNSSCYDHEVSNDVSRKQWKHIAYLRKMNAPHRYLCRRKVDEG